MTTHAAAPAVPTARRILGAGAAGVALLLTLWVLGTAREGGAESAPWGLLIIFVPPYLIGLALLRPVPRVAAVLIGVLNLIFVVATVAALIRDPFEMWAWAAFLVYLGVPLAVAGLAAAVRIVLGR
ncbi:hypothetical protein AB0M20_41825 [Actinoplanes sp. NPDC051633]|uniref:hypothetical protein n=1 Tax=Actinoplanes sp. NPDC051633 TaxID=3155670 RepID=UPI003433F2C5